MLLGKFRFEEDLLNMTHVMADLTAANWKPTGPMNAPPKQPNRDVWVGMFRKLRDITLNSWVTVHRPV